jgi:hypothetical protein
VLSGDSLEQVRPRLEALARDDPESWIRADAERTLAKLPRER